MKKMMKAAIIALAAAGMVMAGGCGSSQPAKSSAGNSSQSALMQKIKKDGKLVVGTASGFPPYEFLDTSVKDQKKIDGIDMKLAEAVAQKLGGEAGGAGYDLPVSSFFHYYREGGHSYFCHQSH